MNWKKIILFLILFLAVCLGFIFLELRFFLTTFNPVPTLVKIPKGSNANQIVGILRQQNIIQFPTVFLWMGKLAGKTRKFKSGTYQIQTTTYWRLLNQIEQGQTYKIKITFPEGWTSYQIAERLYENKIIQNSEEFIIQARAQKLEGKLFPETYYFEVYSSVQEILNLMLAQFQNQYSAAFHAGSKEWGGSELQVLTLASIIEREAQDGSERKVISSVYHNRLKRKQGLEADPTVQFAISDGKFWKERLTYQDLKFDSPYNTYRYRGLPPGPICNPGLKSIEAALYPEPTEYYYFVADGTGKHSFSKTFQEHQSNVKQFRRIRKK